MGYLPPEALQHQEHNHTVDIYGLGVLLFEMLTGRPPFYNKDHNVFMNNIQRSKLIVPRYVEANASLLIQALMQREPAHRLGALSTSHVKGHEFFTGIDFEALMGRETPLHLNSDGLRRFQNTDQSSPK